MFKRTLAIALLLSSTVHAADILETPIIETAPTDWSGWQLSVFGGGIHSNGQANLGNTTGDLIDLDVGNGLFPRSVDSDEFGGIGGIGIGYDAQFGNWVAGAVVDGSLTSLENHHRFSRLDPNPAFPFTGVTTNTSYVTELKWLATARLRLGYAFNDDFMVYGTGGIAIGDVNNRFALSIPDFPILPPALGGGGPYTSPNWSENNTEVGFVVGAGIEKKLTENLRLTFSLQYVDLGNVNVQGTDPDNFPGQELNYSFENTFTTAKVGLSLSF